MSHTISIDLFSCVNSIYARMEEDCKFANSFDNLPIDIADSVLSNISVSCRMIQTTFSHIRKPDAMSAQDIFIQQVSANLLKILKQSSTAYENKIIKKSKYKDVVKEVGISLNYYQDYMKKIGEQSLKNKTIEFNLIEFIPSFRKSISFYYAYSRGMSNSKSSKVGIHEILRFADSFSDVVKSVDKPMSFAENDTTTDFEQSMDFISSHTKVLKDILSKSWITNAKKPKQAFFDPKLAAHSLVTFKNQWDNYQKSWIHYLNINPHHRSFSPLPQNEPDSIKSSSTKTKP